MLVRLFRWPIKFLVGAIFIMALTSILAPLWQSSTVLEGVARGILPIADIGILVFLGLASLTAMHGLYRFYSWERDKENSCRYCTGITNYIADGRYRPYYKCLACNRNDKAHRL